MFQVFYSTYLRKKLKCLFLNPPTSGYQITRKKNKYNPRNFK